MKTAAILLLISVLSAGADTLEEVISKARAFIGPEKALNEINSIRFTGVLLPATEGAEESTLELLIEKPARQKLVIENSQGRAISTVNDTQGYIFQQNLTNGQEASGPMPYDQIQSLKANSIENLYFFDFPTKFQVRERYMGEEELDGREVNAVRFVHRGGIVYFRYFDLETGELVATESDNGLMNLEVGRFEVDGLKFAEEVHAFSDGELVHTIKISQIEINPEIPEGTFSAPE